MIVSLDQAMHLVTAVYDQVKASLKPRVVPSFTERRRQLHGIVSTTSDEQQAHSIRCVEGAFILLWEGMRKLNKAHKKQSQEKEKRKKEKTADKQENKQNLKSVE